MHNCGSSDPVHSFRSQALRPHSVPRTATATATQVLHSRALDFAGRRGRQKFTGAHKGEREVLSGLLHHRVGTNNTSFPLVVVVVVVVVALVFENLRGRPSVSSSPSSVPSSKNHPHHRFFFHTARRTRLTRIARTRNIAETFATESETASR